MHVDVKQELIRESVKSLDVLLPLRSPKYLDEGRAGCVVRLFTSSSIEELMWVGKMVGVKCMTIGQCCSKLSLNQ